jgi:hypothetical protein
MFTNNTKVVIACDDGEFYRCAWEEIAELGELATKEKLKRRFKAKYFAQAYLIDLLVEAPTAATNKSVAGHPEPRPCVCTHTTRPGAFPSLQVCRPPLVEDFLRNNQFVADHRGRGARLSSTRFFLCVAGGGDVHGRRSTEEANDQTENVCAGRTVGRLGVSTERIGNGCRM